MGLYTIWFSFYKLKHSRFIVCFRLLLKSLCCNFSQGGKEYLMRAHFGLPSVEAEDKEGKPPISVKFEIPYFTTSGIQVWSPSSGGFSNNLSTLSKQQAVKQKTNTVSVHTVKTYSSSLCDILSVSMLNQMLLIYTCGFDYYFGFRILGM